MARKFVKNNLNATLGIASEQIILKPFASIVIEGELAAHKEILECSQKGWVTVTDIPDSAPVPEVSEGTVTPPVIETVKNPFEGSLTMPGTEPKAEVVEGVEAPVEVVEVVEAPVETKKSSKKS